MSLISKDQGGRSLLIAQNDFYVQCTCSLNSTNKKDDIRYVNHFMCLKQNGCIVQASLPILSFC